MASPSHRLRFVVCCGMIRSGSTLQYNLVHDLLAAAGKVRPLGYLTPGGPVPDLMGGQEIALCKLHHFDPNIAKLLEEGHGAGFYCFRDLRDVAVSSMRKFNLSFQRLWEERWLQGAVENGERWLSVPHVYSATYVSLVRELKNETQRIAEWLSLEVPETTIIEVAQRNSFAAIKERVARLSPSERLVYDPASLFHPSNLHEGKIGGWKEVLTDAQVELIENSFEDWLNVRGYPIGKARPAEPIVQDRPDETHVAHIGWLAHPREDEVARMLREGHFEPDLQAFFRLFLRPGDRFLDVGAHLGLYSRLAGTLTQPGGQTVAVEPNPLILPYLQSNLAPDPAAQIKSVALGERNGTGTMLVAAGGFSSHSALTIEGPGNIDVPLLTLDKLLQDLDWDRVDLVKIDTEGHEFAVLEGASRCIGTPDMAVLTIEFAEKNFLTIGRNSRQLFEVLQKRGYQVCRFDAASLQLIPVTTDVCPVWYENFIAVLDLDAVNCRLHEAPVTQRRIAGDILVQAAARSTLREFAELDTYRKQAQLANSFRHWAERTEAMLKAERAIAQTERDTLRQVQALADQHKAWALNTEALLQEERQLSSAHRSWAEDTERRLTQAQKELTEAQAWAERTEERLTQVQKELAEARGWAERTEVLLKAARQEAANHLAWAQRTEELLAEARAATRPS